MPFSGPPLFVASALRSTGIRTGFWANQLQLRISLRIPPWPRRVAPPPQHPLFKGEKSHEADSVSGCRSPFPHRWTPRCRVSLGFLLASSTHYPNGVARGGRSFLARCQPISLRCRYGRRLAASGRLNQTAACCCCCCGGGGVVVVFDGTTNLSGFALPSQPQPHRRTAWCGC